MRSSHLALLVVLVSTAVACSQTGSGRRKQNQNNNNNNSAKPDLRSPDEETGDQPDLRDPFEEGEPYDLKKPPSDLKQPQPDFATTTNSGPTVSSLSSSPSYAYDGETVTFTVTVGHPIGLDYIYSVVLTDSSNNTYGTMYSSGFDGVYTITLGWTQIDAVSDLSFTSSTSRSFKATATDIEYKTKATSAYAVTFACYSASQACNGVCGGCTTGGTATMTTCSASYLGSDTCSSICAGYGKTCAESACGGKTISVQYSGCGNGDGGGSATCSQTISTAGYSTTYYDGVSCCCQ